MGGNSGYGSEMKRIVGVHQRGKKMKNTGNEIPMGPPLESRQ